MNLEKCKCGFICNQFFITCPSCNRAEKQERVNTNDLDEVIYKLTMDDVDNVLDNDIDGDLADRIKDVPREVLMQIVRDRIEMPWSEYIEGVLESSFRGDF